MRLFVPKTTSLWAALDPLTSPDALNVMEPARVTLVVASMAPSWSMTPPVRVTLPSPATRSPVTSLVTRPGEALPRRAVFTPVAVESGS